MSRYIEADALKANCYKQMDKLMESTSEHLSAEALSLLCGFTLIDSAPSIDIVRCKECKYHKPSKIWAEIKPCIVKPFPSMRCKMLNREVNADDFCSYGEREGE